MELSTFNTRVEELETALRTRLRLRGRDFGVQLRRAGRLLPKRIHRAGHVLTEARTKLSHPKLARQIDPVLVEKAFEEINAHLATVDPADRRKGAILGWLGALVFNLIVVCALVIGLLRWQGLI